MSKKLHVFSKKPLTLRAGWEYIPPQRGRRAAGDETVRSLVTQIETGTMCVFQSAERQTMLCFVGHEVVSLRFFEN